jgi:SHS2 domain-containing protein
VNEGYATFDHTGDLGLEVWAESPERLHELAAVALLSQVAEAAPGAPDEIRAELSLEGSDPADLLVHWLNSALLEADVRRAVWTRAQVRRLGPRFLEAELAGPRLDRTRQTFLREVKAVSHHGLELVLEPPRCSCRLVLDL